MNRTSIAAALLFAASACEHGTTVSHACREDAPVAAYAVVPVFVGGYYAADDTGWYGDPSASYDDDPPADDPSFDPGTDPPPPSDEGDDGTVTLSLRPQTYAGTGCFTCRIACTLDKPGGPPALNAVGSSNLSYGDACHAAQTALVRYAQDTWSTSPKTCGHPAPAMLK